MYNGLTPPGYKGKLPSPASKTTRLEVSLCRSGKIDHHDFVFELPEGMDPKEFLEELEESGLRSLWSCYRGIYDEVDYAELTDCDCVEGPGGVEVKILDHHENETHFDMDEVEIRWDWDCLKQDNLHIEAFKN